MRIQIPHFPKLTPIAAGAATLAAIAALTSELPFSFTATDGAITVPHLVTLATMLLLCSVALLALEYGQRVFALGLASGVALVIAATIAAWVIDIAPPFGVYLFGKQEVGTINFPVAHARDIAIPIALASLAIVLLAMNFAHSVTRAVGWAVGAIIAALPGIRLLATLTTPVAALATDDHAPLPTILASLAVSLLGVALMGSRHTSSIASGPRTTTDWNARLRSLVVVIVASITLVFWHTLRAAEFRQLQSQVQEASRSIVADWQSGLADRARATDRLSQHWINLGWPIPTAVFLADSRAFMRDYAGIHAVVLTDVQGRITKIARRNIALGTPPSAADDVLLVDAVTPGFPLELVDNFLPVARSAIATASRVRSPAITVGATTLIQTAGPVVDSNQQIAGTVVLVFRRDINDAALLADIAPNFYVRVFTNSELTYDSTNKTSADLVWLQSFVAKQKVRFGFNDYVFEVAPTQAIVDRSLTWTPALVLVFAWAALVLLTFALYSERRAFALARDRERILNESLDLICTMDAQGRYVTVNDTSLPVLGYKPSELIGRHWSELTHPSDREMLFAQWERALSGIRPPAVPLRFMHKNGSVVYLQGNAHWSAPEQLFYCDMRDVSDQQSLELAREHAAKTFNTGVEQAGCVVYEYLYETQQLVWVGAIRGLTGYEPADLAASGFEGWMDAIHPDDRAHVRNTLQRCLESHQPHTIDYRLRRKDGEYVPVLDRGRHVDDAAQTQPRMIGALIDLSAIRQQENALRRSEERYRIIATQVGAVILERDTATGRVRIFGPVEQIYGYTKEQIESRPYGPEDTMIHVDDRARVAAIVADAERNLKSYYVEYRRRHRGGHYIYIASRGVVLPGADGRAERSVVAVTDITERKLAEERLQDSDERFRLAAEQAGQIVYEIAMGEKLEIVQLRFAGASEHVLGYSSEELRNLQSTDQFSLIHPDDIPGVRAASGESLSSSYQFNVEHRLRHRDGHYVHVENRGAVRRDVSGNVVGIVGMLLDISARKAAETERQVYTLQLTKLAEIARKVSTLLSLHELLNYLSRSMRELIGANAAAAIVEDALSPESSVGAVSYAEHYGAQRGEPKPFGSPELHALLKGGNKPVRLTVAHVIADPRFAHLTQNDDLQHPMRGWLAAPLTTRDGQGLGLLEMTDKLDGDFTEGDAQVLGQLAGLASVAIENIGLYATLEERVAARTRELQISNRELEAFSYSVSHDLRAPLRAIAGFSSILEQEYAPKLDTAARRYIQRISSGVERMANLIDDLLSLARVSRLDIKRESIDLTSLCRSITKRQLERWPDRDLQVKIDPRMRVNADPRLVEVALENLIENAIKFTGTRMQSQIHIGKRPASGQAAFFVHDNGVGFDPQYAANLFGVFQRLHSASEFPGTGVGLATVQRIMQRHHGRVWAESQIDEGATFYFTFDSEA